MISIESIIKADLAGPILSWWERAFHYRVDASIVSYLCWSRSEGEMNMIAIRVRRCLLAGESAHHAIKYAFYQNITNGGEINKLAIKWFHRIMLAMRIDIMLRRGNRNIVSKADVINGVVKPPAPCHSGRIKGGQKMKGVNIFLLLGFDYKATRYGGLEMMAISNQICVCYHFLCWWRAIVPHPVRDWRRDWRAIFR